MRNARCAYVKDRKGTSTRSAQRPCTCNVGIMRTGGKYRERIARRLTRMRKIEPRTKSPDEKSFIARFIVHAINSTFLVHRLSALLSFARVHVAPRGLRRPCYRRFRFRFFSCLSSLSPSSRKRDLADPAARKSRVLLLDDRRNLSLVNYGVSTLCSIFVGPMSRSASTLDDIAVVKERREKFSAPAETKNSNYSRPWCVKLGGGCFLRRRRINSH